MTEETAAEDHIPETKRIIVGLKKPIAEHLKTYDRDTSSPKPEPDLHRKAAQSILNSMDIIGELYVPRLADPDYRGLVMAAIAYIDPNSVYRNETPTFYRREDLGVNYSNIAGSDPRLEVGLKQITDLVMRAEQTDIQNRRRMTDLNDRVNEGIDLLNTMEMSLDRKR